MFMLFIVCECMLMSFFIKILVYKYTLVLVTMLFQIYLFNFVLVFV